MPEVESPSPADGDPFELACDRFEAAWRRTIREQAERPRLEDHLAGFESADSVKLLHELLLVEWEYRRRREQLDVHEYTARFPESSELVRAAFLTLTGSEGGEGVQESPKESSGIGTSSSSGSRFKNLKFYKQGGLGQIWIAEDRELNRKVAIKDIRAIYADDLEVRSRFVTEAELTGKLEHPGIVPVYGLGEHPNGRPFYATRFIRGASLADAIKQYHSGSEAKADVTDRVLELRELLRRFVDICNTVEYAHSLGVLHRDLKPDNILLGDYGETLVIDWGLAKVPRQGSREDPASESESADEKVCSDESAGSDENELLDRTWMHLQGSAGSAPTQAGSIMGTPQYMSPEQAAGGLSELGPASDVYSLGATFYCILTGKAPFFGRRERDVRWEVQEGRFAPPRKVNPGVPRPLDAICLKAMSRRPEERYQSPGELSADVNRWLADEPVGAARENWWQRAGRWARRNRTWVQAGAVALLLVSIVSVVAALLINTYWQDAEVARQDAEIARQDAETAQRQAEDELERTRRSRYAIQVANAMKLEYAEPGRALELLGDLEICPADLRDFTWRHCYRRCRRDRLRLKADSEAVRLAAFGSEDERLISVGAEGTVKIWNAASGELLLQWETGQTVTAAAIREDKRLLATAGDDGSIRLWDVPKVVEESEGGEAEKVKPAAALGEQVEAARRLAFSADGKTLASLHEGEQSFLAVWDVASRERLRIYEENLGELTVSQRAPSLAVSPDGLRVAWGAEGGESISGRLRIYAIDDTNRKVAAYNKAWRTSERSNWSDETGQFPNRESISCLAFKAALTDRPPSTDTLVYGCNHGALARFDVDRDYLDTDNGPFHTRDPVHHGTVRALAFDPSPGASAVATAGVGYSRRVDIHTPYRPIVESLLEVCDGRMVISKTRYLAGISDLKEVTDLEFDGTGARLLTVSTAAILTVFDRTDDWYGTQIDHRKAVFGQALSADGWIRAADFSVDGKSLLTVCEDESSPVNYWDRDSGEWRSPPVFAEDRALLAMPGGKIFKNVRQQDQDSPEEIRVVDALYGRNLGKISLDAGEEAVAVCVQRRLVAVRDSQRQLKIWNLESGRLEQVLAGAAGATGAAGTSEHHPVAFAPQGGLLASGLEGDPGRVAIWDLSTGKMVASWESVEGESHGISAIAFSPHGATLAVGHECGGGRSTRFGAGGVIPALVTLSDVSTCKVLATLKGHGGEVRGLTFSPDGRTLATASEDGTARLWDVKSGVQMASLSAERGTVYSVAFSPDGQTLATAHHNQTVVLWHTATDKTVESHRKWREASELVRSLDNQISFDDATPLEDAILRKSKLVRSIRADGTIGKEVREHALELADGLLKRYEREALEVIRSLSDAAWDIAGRPDLSQAKYETALYNAEAACELKPDDGLLLGMLGAAQYRNGQYNEALKTLHRSEELLKDRIAGAEKERARVGTTERERQAAGTVPNAHAINLAFIAMARFQLKDLDGAVDALRESEDVKARGAGGLVIPIWREAHALLTGL